MILTRTDTGETHTVDVARVDFGANARVTDHPVELGAEVTDHIQVQPLPFTVEALVSDSPRLSSPVTLRNTRMATTFFEGAVGKLCTVVLDGEGTFQSYALESCAHTRTSELGRSYTLRFRQIRIASAVSVLLPPRLPAPVANVGQPTEQELGQQAAVPVDVPAESAAYAAAAALAGLL